MIWGYHYFWKHPYEQNNPFMHNGVLSETLPTSRWSKCMNGLCKNVADWIKVIAEQGSQSWMYETWCNSREPCVVSWNSSMNRKFWRLPCVVECLKVWLLPIGNIKKSETNDIRTTFSYVKDASERSEETIICLICMQVIRFKIHLNHQQ